MENTIEKVTLLKQDIQNIYNAKDLYKLEEIANLYSITVSTIKYIQRLSNVDVKRMSSMSVTKHQYKYIDDEESPKPKPKAKKSDIKKEKKVYYKKKDPSEKKHRKLNITDEQIRYIRKNPDQLTLKQLSQLLNITESTVTNYKYFYSGKFVKNEGEIYQPDPKLIEEIKNQSVKKKKPEEKKHRKPQLSDSQIRYIRKNPDKLTLRQMMHLLEISRGKLDSIKYYYVAKNVSEEGEIYQPDPKLIEEIKKNYPKKPNSQPKIFFTDQQIQEMKSSGLSSRKLAKKYGVSPTTIRRNLGMK
ncbi:hypothetical protein WJR50_18900 [Catalinimonas sp. 4WD22]|uniref:hypothetical protein n=1 Tax=Catalinimonas locisalis TaxID=3133978 RepID=UPI003101102D